MVKNSIRTYSAVALLAGLVLAGCGGGGSGGSSSSSSATTSRTSFDSLEASSTPQGQSIWTTALPGGLGQTPNPVATSASVPNPGYDGHNNLLHFGSSGSFYTLSPATGSILHSVALPVGVLLRFPLPYDPLPAVDPDGTSRIEDLTGAIESFDSSGSYLSSLPAAPGIGQVGNQNYLYGQDGTVWLYGFVSLNVLPAGSGAWASYPSPVGAGLLVGPDGTLYTQGGEAILSNGTVAWTVTPPSSFFSPTCSAALDSTGQLDVLCSDGKTGLTELWAVKAGVLLWTDVVVSANGGAPQLAVAPDNSIVVSVCKYPATGGVASFCELNKYSASGTLQWSHQFETSFTLYGIGPQGQIVGHLSDVEASTQSGLVGVRVDGSIAWIVSDPGVNAPWLEAFFGNDGIVYAMNQPNQTAFVGAYQVPN